MLDAQAISGIKLRVSANRIAARVFMRVFLCRAFIRVVLWDPCSTVLCKIGD